LPAQFGRLRIARFSASFAAIDFALSRNGIIKARTTVAFFSAFSPACVALSQSRFSAAAVSSKAARSSTFVCACAEPDIDEYFTGIGPVEPVTNDYPQDNAPVNF
jgi:hypothetical protein